MREREITGDDGRSREITGDGYLVEAQRRPHELRVLVVDGHLALR